MPNIFLEGGSLLEQYSVTWVAWHSSHETANTILTSLSQTTCSQKSRSLLSFLEALWVRHLAQAEGTEFEFRLGTTFFLHTYSLLATQVRSRIYCGLATPKCNMLYCNCTFYMHRFSGHFFYLVCCSLVKTERIQELHTKMFTFQFVSTL